jgi:PAS domain S-box-containing protein
MSASRLFVREADGSFVGGEPPEAVRRALASSIATLAESGGRERVPELLVEVDGRTRCYQVEFSAVGSAAPHPIAIALCELDRQDAYRLARFDLVLEATRDGVWEWVVADGAVWWNQRCNEILGYAPDAAPTFAAWTERIHPDEREHVLAGYMGTVDSPQSTWQDEYRILRPDGAVRTVFDRGQVERDEHGKAIRLVGVMSDVTEERSAQAARAELDQQFRQMAETLADALWMADANTREVVYVSASFDRIFGRPAREVLGKPEAFLAMIHADDRERIVERLPAQARGEYDETYRIVRPDGKVRWVRARARGPHS